MITFCHLHLSALADSPDGYCEQMARIHQLSFPEGDAWSTESFRRLAFAAEETTAQQSAFLALIPANKKITEGEEQIHILCGFLLLRTVANESEILTLAVHPDHRRHGMAQRLISQALKEAQEHKSIEVFLEVAEDNAAARALYDGFGFSLAGRRPEYYAHGRAGLTLRHVLKEG